MEMGPHRSALMEHEGKQRNDFPARWMQQKPPSASEHAGIVRLGSRTRERSQLAMV